MNFTGLFFDQIRCDSLQLDSFSKLGIDFRVIRFDLIDPLTGGNKWFKIAPWLELAEVRGIKTLVSFGGAYSNHIAALAAIGQRYNLKTVGIIRGEAVRNITLDRAISQGMELEFISREVYRELRNSGYNHPLLEQFDDALIIPEGGGGEPGRRGAYRMREFIPDDTDHIVIAAGTGTTAAGISDALKSHQYLHVIPVIKNAGEILSLFRSDQVTVHTGYEHGGYARSNLELENFCSTFSYDSGIPVEPVYTGKAFMASLDLAKKGVFGSNTKVSLLHTGGLQYQNS